MSEINIQKYILGEDACLADALKIINNSRELANKVMTFHSNCSESEVVGERAKAIVENNKGAISGLMRRLDDIFPEKQI